MNFQSRVQGWMQTCFGPTISADKVERNDRFIEDALELVQALGYKRQRAHALVDYVFDRPIGEPSQEAGGVMVTLAALCEPNGLDMDAAAETELSRILAPEVVAKIRAKQAAKPTGSALPATKATARCAPYDPHGIGAALLDIALAVSREYTFSPDDGADHYPSEFERMLLADYVLSLTGHDGFNHVLLEAQEAINARARLFVAVDYHGCVYQSQDLDRVIEIAKGNAGSVATLLGAGGPVSRGALDVLAERLRQVDGEGWTPEHDDAHVKGEMACAAISYVMGAVNPNGARAWWPWSSDWFRPGDDIRRMLVKAAALIVAEIERLDRKSLREESRD